MLSIRIQYIHVDQQFESVMITAYYPQQVLSIDNNININRYQYQSITITISLCGVEMSTIYE